MVSAASSKEWRVVIISALLRQRRGEVCRSKDDLRRSIEIFRTAIDSMRAAARGDAESLAWLWLGRNQASLYAWGDDEDKELMRLELPKTIAHLDSVQIDWKEVALRGEPAGDFKPRFVSELIAIRGINERIKSRSREIPTGLDTANPSLCPRLVDEVIK